jgi:hypothetical protein
MASAGADADGVALARLPGLKPLDKTPAGSADSNYVEVTAYSPGYCAVQTAPGREPGFRLGRIKSDRFDYTGRSIKVVSEGAITLQTVRHADSAEHRILYLTDVAQQLSCSHSNWSGETDAARAAMGAAMVAEASAIAKSPYEKFLVRELESALRAAPNAADSMEAAVLRPVQAPRHGALPMSMLIAPEGTPIHWGDGRMPVVAVGRGSAVAAARAAAVPAGAPAGTTSGAAPVVAAPAPTPAPPKLRIHCRNKEPGQCDVNERDSTGLTLLHRMINAGKVNEVAVLLEAGADPNIAAWPGAHTALELMLQSATNHQTAYGGAERLAAKERILDMLVRDGRASLSAEVKAHLQSDPATWWVQDAGVKSFFQSVKEKTATLPVRPAFAPSCPRDVQQLPFVLKRPT